MKPSKFFLMGAIAIGLVACNNEEVANIDPNAPEATISIKVYPSSSSDLRTTGDISGNGVNTVGLAAESAIKNMEVWVYAGKTLDKYASKANATEINDIECTTGVRTIVVAVNANIGSEASLDVLKAKTKELSQNISTNGLAMTTEPISVTLVKGNNYYGYNEAGMTANVPANAGDKTNLTPGATDADKKALALTRINARVAIVSAVLDLPTVAPFAPFDNLRDVQVAMFNVPKDSKYFGSSLAENSNYWYGQSWASTASSYDKTITTAQSTLYDAVTFPIVNTAAPYYYVNENTSKNANQKTMIVLRGKLYSGDDPVVVSGVYTDDSGYSYYPIWVNADDLGYTYTGTRTANEITRNTQYNISLTITGVGNPTIDKPEKAWFHVKIEVAPWKVVTQNVTW